MSRHDYLPFGEEVGGASSPNTGRGSLQSYNYGSVRQKFTGYEKDDETGLDFAQARYYGNSSGRFTSPDSLLSSAEPAVPQTWNRYAYVLNDPLNLVDPFGLDVWMTNGSGAYRVVSDADYYKYINDPNCDWQWAPVPVGTNIGKLWDFLPDTPIDFILRNNQLIGKEVVLGADFNFQPAHPESPYLYLDDFKAEMGRRAPALKQATEYMFMADVSIISGFSTIGSVGTTSLGLESASGGDGILVSQKGLDLIENQLARAELEHADYNDAMLDRLRSALEKGERVTGPDKEFYMHESNEAALMNRGLEYGEAHASALERFGVKEFDLYHPDVIKAYKFGPAWFDYWGIPR